MSLRAILDVMTPADDRLKILKDELFHLQQNFAELTVEKITSLSSKIKELYTLTYDRIANLKGYDELSFQNVIQPIINAELCTDKAFWLCCFSQHCHPNEEVRKKSNEATTELKQFFVDCMYRQDVYEVLKSYQGDDYLIEQTQLHPEENRYFLKLMQKFERNGLNAQDDSVKQRLIAIKQALADKYAKFSKNINDVNTSFIFSEIELEGAPSAWLASKKFSDADGATRYKVTLQYPDVEAVQKHAKNRETRKKINLAFNSRCKDSNIPLLMEILQLRQEQASLLGFSSHEEYVTADLMTKTSATVKEFLDELQHKLAPLLRQNLADLTAFAKTHENDPNFELTAYDLQFYTRLFTEQRFNIDMEQIRSYCPTNKVVAGTLDIYQDLLGLKFVEIKNAHAWHDEVRTFDVLNTDDGKLIGRFCLDLHPRQGKFTHAAVWNLAHGADISAFTNIPGDRKTPIMAMLCNFGKTGGLTFYEMVTFFHEFGHLMHGICANTKLAEFSQLTKLERDFVECPSKMLEYWCFDEKVLEKLTAHPESGKPLPIEIAKKLEAADKLFAGYESTRLLMLSVFDFLIHSMSKEELNNLNVVTFFDRLRLEILQVPNVEGSAYPASFGHLVSGYDGVIYGYLFAETFAADLFNSKFKSNLLDPIAGRQYRKAILEPCGSVDPIDLLTRYLGRKPSIDAFLSDLGLNTNPDQQIAESTEKTRAVVNR